MTWLKSILQQYKIDIIHIICLIMIFTVFAVTIGPVYGDLYVDFPREAYIPEMLLQGKILHKDIFAWYNPLVYQFNTILYAIFSPNFKVIYTASYVNAVLLLIGLWSICRIFVKAFYASAFAIFITAYYIFSNILSICSLIAPYSYGFAYAGTLVVYSALMFILYIKTDKIRFAYLSSLFLGLAYANKPEFLLCMFPIFVSLILKKTKFKSILICASLIILPTVLSYAVLFIQGFTFADFKDYIKLCIGFGTSPEQIYYNKTYLMQPLNLENLICVVSYFSSVVFLLASGTAYLSLSLKNKYSKIFGIIIFPFYTAAVFGLISYIYLGRRASDYFCWEIIVLVIILCICAKRGIKSPKDKMLSFLTIQGILSMSRVGFFPIAKFSCGIFSLLPITTLWIFIMSSEKFLSKFNFKRPLAICLIFFSLIWYVSIFKGLDDAVFEVTPYDFGKDGGKIYSEGRYVNVFKKSVEWVNKNTDINDTILVLPEGVFLNYVTKRPTFLKYYQLTPNHLSIFGEENIVKDLIENKPEYMVTNNYVQYVYGKSYICDDFALKICDFINTYYTPVATFESKNSLIDNSDKFQQKFYKLKPEYGKKNNDNQ